MGLTVGFVSGIIAAVVFAAQLFVPFAIGLAIIGLIAPENSIVSWSVISRTLHSTHWPVVLSSDTAASTGVSGGVKISVWFQMITLVTIAIASIVTPLGLYEEISPEDSLSEVPFHFAPDKSAFGRATPPRDGYRAVRLCYRKDEDERNRPCPNAPSNFHDIVDTVEAYSVWPGSVSIFTSGETAETVSSIFDIQWRGFRVGRGLSFTSEKNATAFSQGYYRQFGQFVQDEALLAIDGLLVDTEVGRIGFRNHTVPVKADDGAQWTEDILFIEPDARCVDTNLTIDYTNQGEGKITDEPVFNPVLVDHGGFSDLPHSTPDLGNPDAWQDDPLLYERAFRGAWRNNLLAMQLWNVTTNGSDGSAPFSYMNSHISKEFKLDDYTAENILAPGIVQTTDSYGNFLGLPPANYSYSDKDGGPLNLTEDDSWVINDYACGTPSRDAQSNMSFVATSCGLVYAPGRRTDGGDPLRTEETNSTWSTPLYSCSASTKAVIRQVTFRINGTGELGHLIVENISAKPQEPLWGVERLQNITIELARPLWGIVSPEVGERSDISTVQREHLWLPGYPDLALGPPIAGSSTNGMPGNLFYSRALSDLFRIGTYNDGEVMRRYTGSDDAALGTKWLELSNSTSGMETILRLVWTDISANAVVGTRSWLSSSSPSGLSKQDDSPSTVNVPVTLWSRRVKYHVPYAIPAILALLLTFALGGFTLFLLLMRRTGIDKMRLYLAQTSTGRTLAHFMFPGESSVRSPTRQWIRQVGKPKVFLPGSGTGGIVAASCLAENGYHRISTPDEHSVKWQNPSVELRRISQEYRRES